MKFCRKLLSSWKLTTLLLILMTGLTICLTTFRSTVEHWFLPDTLNWDDLWKADLSRSEEEGCWSLTLQAYTFQPGSWKDALSERSLTAVKINEGPWVPILYSGYHAPFVIREEDRIFIAMVGDPAVESKAGTSLEPLTELTLSQGQLKEVSGDE